MISQSRRILYIMLIVSVVLVIGGTAWAIAEGVRGAQYGKATATVTACEKQQTGNDEVNARVLVKYKANGTLYENVTYIGDLNRCYVGLSMRVYYKKSAPSEYVYSKSSDLGFSLILLAGGVLWLAITVGYMVVAKQTGRLCS